MPTLTVENGSTTPPGADCRFNDTAPEHRRPEIGASGLSPRYRGASPTS
jgi:hypothetical protein